MAESSDILRKALASLPTATAILLRDHAAAPWYVSSVSCSFAALFQNRDTVIDMTISDLLPEVSVLIDFSRGTHRFETGCQILGNQTTALIELAPLEGLPNQAVLQVGLRPGSSRRSGSRSGERHLREIANNVMALIYLKRTDGSYTFVNRYYESIVGTRADQIRGKSDFDLWPPDIARSYHEADKQVMASGVPMKFEEPIPRDGELGMWLSLKFPLYDDDGSLYGVGGISTDISDRNEVEAAIREARDEAERANQAKSAFLSRMSHELRTPLNSILGYGQLLQLEHLPEPSASGVESIIGSGKHLLTLINEVLDITRIEAGSSEIKSETIYICDPLREAYEMIRPLAAARQIELARDLHGILYQAVQADAQRLKQVFLNVLMNAIKYNRPEGVVTVWGSVDDGKVRVLITDTGAGIPKRDISRIFTPFERLGAERNDIEGTGLGLTVSKDLIEAMGGAIGVTRSVVGRGTEFFIELPAADPSDADSVPGSLGVSGLSPSTVRGGVSGASILYIDDNSTNVDVVQRILERYGCGRFRAAATAAHGLAAARSSLPDVILLDVNLPDMHGEEVLVALRKNPDTARIPVIVLSADATKTQHKKMLKAGAFDYITKPVDVGELLEVLQRSRESTRTENGHENRIGTQM